jgi:hypothetical protein
VSLIDPDGFRQCPLVLQEKTGLREGKALGSKEGSAMGSELLCGYVAWGEAEQAISLR